MSDAGSARVRRPLGMFDGEVAGAASPPRRTASHVHNPSPRASSPGTTTDCAPGWAPTEMPCPPLTARLTSCTALGVRRSWSPWRRAPTPSRPRIQKMGEGNPAGRIAYPREMGKAAAFLSSAASSFITGVELFADGGMAQV
ncbi:SDR family oxidoreductase [Streptomyces oryzae]|uniref:SDR family oxidoreductase n=1 Tax=Streptomyces oryzae TaxID=1434886 RepID=A0ABS3XGN5_9ACTN|nr:SDR family oxidoreductase [Streptomyces oryzae]